MTAERHPRVTPKPEPSARRSIPRHGPGQGRWRMKEAIWNPAVNDWSIAKVNPGWGRGGGGGGWGGGAG